ncbi:unnamed protein product, partial [Prorocentrum cordatum]
MAQVACYLVRRPDPGDLGVGSFGVYERASARLEFEDSGWTGVSAGRKQRKRRKKLVQDWLLGSGRKLVKELFSVPRVADSLKGQGYPVSKSLDLRTGYDLGSPSGERAMWSIIERDRPEVIVMSPECLAFSVARRPSWRRLKGTDLADPETAGLKFMSLCVRVAENQMGRGRGFLLEHPEGASSWEMDSVREILNRPSVVSGVADLCQCGLSVKGGEPNKKPTRFMTNRASILQPLLLRCDGSHQHRQLCGRALTRAAQNYPPGLVQAMCEGILESARIVALGHREETLWSGVWEDPEWLAERRVTG